MAENDNIKDSFEQNEIFELSYTSFEDAKNNLQKFSEETISNYDIDSVETEDGLFGWFSHKVRGEELNQITSQIQDHLISINQVNRDVIKEFGEVYTALESLDREYIPAIMSGVKGAEAASNQAKEATEKVALAQQDIRKAVEEQKKIICVLEKHKEKLDKLQHLDNVDEIWNKLEDIENEFDVYKGNFNKQISRKIRFSYIAAVIATTVSIVEFILLMTGAF